MHFLEPTSQSVGPEGPKDNTVVLTGVLAADLDIPVLLPCSDTPHGPLRAGTSSVVGLTSPHCPLPSGQLGSAQPIPTEHPEMQWLVAAQVGRRPVNNDGAVCGGGTVKEESSGCESRNIYTSWGTQGKLPGWNYTSAERCEG